MNKENEVLRERYKKLYADSIRTIDFLASFKGPNSMNLKEILKAKNDYRKASKVLLQNDPTFWEPVFDAGYYAENNQDVVLAVGDDEKKLLKHFVCRGMDEGRRANKEFDIFTYIKCNPDLLTSEKKDLRDLYLHYIIEGKKEGRQAAQGRIQA